MPQLVAALAMRRGFASTTSWRAQVRRILDAGIRPTHLDTHKHTHLAPPVLDAVARLAEEFGVRWVRRPFDFPLHALRARCAATEAADQRRAGADAAALPPRAGEARVPHHGPLRGLPDHRPLSHAGTGRIDVGDPGGQHGADGSSRSLRSRSARGAHAVEREPRAELAALVAPEVRAAMLRHGIELVNYAGLGG